MNTSLKKKINIFFVGDSHLDTWAYANKNNIGTDVLNIVKIVSLAGKTAQGLAKINNRNIFLGPFKKYEGTIDFLAINFGEVDCGYALWSRMNIHNTTKQQEIDFAMKGIQLLIDEARAIKPCNIILMAPIIPLIAQYSNRDAEIVRRRREVLANHKERTNLVLAFSKRLQIMAKTNKFEYVSVNDILLDKRTGVVKEEYTNLGAGWHLAPRVGASIWVNQMIKTLI